MLPVRKSLRLQNKGPQTTLALDTTSYAAREPVSHWHASIVFNVKLEIKHYEMI